MSGQIPAGWYPDPSAPDRLRWWDGTAWGDPLPEASALPAATPAAPVPAPAYGEYAPAAPAYAAAPPVGVVPPQAGIVTNTIWIWLAIAASTLPMLTVFLVDWNAYIAFVVADVQGGGSAPADLGSFVVQSLLVSLVGWAMLAASVVFSWLDWRELVRRGVDRPFHWAWSFFALAQFTLGVYVIGRAIVVRRRAGAGGRGPLWAWIIVTIVGVVVVGVWAVDLIDTLFTELVQQMPNV
ncbi:MAG: DUF2510 domain-containing protein [Microbacterium sp.]